MNKKYVLIIAILVGICAALWVYREDIALRLLRENTERDEQELKRHIQMISGSASKIEAETKTQVVIYREKAIREVSALPADDIANQLNFELALFRSMDARAEGMGNK